MTHPPARLHHLFDQRLAATPGYRYADKVADRLFVAGQVPHDADANLVGAQDARAQARQCLGNVKARLEAQGSSLDKVVWANWSLREPSDFDEFSEEWVRWFSDDAPVGQGTLMPPSQRRAGFRVSIGVIAEA